MSPMTWETVSVPLIGGLDTKTDAKAVLPTKLTLLENGEFTKGGSLRKRFGYRALSAELVDRTPVTGINGLFSLGDALLESTSHKLYSLDGTTERLLEVGHYDPTTHVATEQAVISAEQTATDCATNNNVTVYVWQDSRGGIRGAVYNDATGAPYETDWQIATSDAERPKVLAVGAHILVFYFVPSTDNIKVRVVKSTDVIASLAVASADVVTDVATTGIYDVCSNGTEAFLFYATDGTVVTGTRLARVNSSGVASQFVTVTADVVTKAADVYNAHDGLLYLAWYNGTGVFAASYRASDFVPVGSETVNGTIANVTNVAVAPSSKTPTSTQRGAHVAFEVSAASTSNHIAYLHADVLNTPTTLTLRHAGLVSSGWAMNDRGYFLVSHESRTGVQHSYYLVRITQGTTGTADAKYHIVGRVLSGEGIGIVNLSHLPRVSSLSSTEYQGALGFRRKLTVKDSGSPTVPGQAAFEHKGIRRVVFNSDPTPKAVEFGRALYLTGSQLWCSDGSQVVESGMHMFPDLLSADITTTATADADITVGTYSYRVYYEWTTANGERFRSAAITRSHQTAGGFRLQLVIPTLSFTNKLESEGLTDVSIVVYRSEVNKSQLFYRVSSAVPGTANPNGYLENDPTADTVTFTDGMSDATLLTQELDYLSQGERPNLAPEGAEYLQVVQNRLWLLGGGQNPGQVRYSKLRFDGTPAEFTINFAVTEAPQFGGAHVALGYLNESPVIFKESAIYALEGIGPDNTGANGSYVPRSISTDFGTSWPASVYSTPDGIYFEAPEGKQLLGQDGNISYVGAEAEAYNGLSVTGVLGVPNTNQILFLASDGQALMFDTFYKQWSLFTNHSGAQGVALWGNQFVYLRSDGTVYVRDTSTYTDAGVHYKLKFRTAPLHLKNDLQGFWRCRRLGVLGEYKSSHRLLVGVYYDRDEGPFETFEWTPDTVLDLGTWGSLATWGATGTVWGGAIGSRDYRFTHRLKRQKCETVRFEFEDLSAGPVPGASFELTELTLEVGLRDGIGRLGASRKV